MTIPVTRHAAVEETEVAHPSVGTLVKEASDHLSTLVRSEVELAKTELKAEVKKATTGSISLILAGVLALVALPFIFVTLAEVLILVGLPRWAGYACIVGFFFVLAALFALLGIRKIKKIKKPERTVSSMKKNSEIARAFKKPGKAA